MGSKLVKTNTSTRALARVRVFTCIKLNVGS